jgi:hypothetical protein
MIVGLVAAWRANRSKIPLPLGSVRVALKVRKGPLEGGTGCGRADWLFKENPMPRSNREPATAETGKQVPARPHDSGSAANETVDGLDATTEALRHAAEDTPSGAGPDDLEKTPVFDRAGQAPKI